MNRAILLLNLGGPDTLRDVEPFLFRLFSDPEIIRVKWGPLRRVLARAIATARLGKSKKLYAAIGGGSPIRKLTEAQAAGVEEILKKSGKPALVRTAFTCSPPFVEHVVRDVAALGAKKILALPLYPQFSFTTTKGSLDRTRAAMEKEAPNAKLFEVRSWPTHPGFLKAHAELIRKEAANFAEPKDSRIHLLFSAHSIPEKLVTEKGDPYRNEVEATAAGVVAAAGWKGPFSLAWQSKLGPVKWLGPSTHDAIVELGQKKVSQLLVVPIAFVSDHIETLHEIDIEFREEAARAGIREFRRTPGLNSNPTFLQALADIAREQTEFWA